MKIHHFPPTLSTPARQRALSSLPRLFLIFALFFAAGKISAAPAAPSAPDAAPERRPWRYDPQKAAAELEEQWRRLTKPGAPTGARGTARFALEAAALAWHPERVEHALALLRSMQDTDPESPTHGNFRRTSLQKTPMDQNVVEFVSEMLGVIHNQSRDHLTDKARAQLAALMTTAVEGLKNHAVKPGYTNVWLKKTWCLIALGEALGRPDIAGLGYAQLDTWLRFTAENGITEFNAPTYYGTDLDSLGLIANHARRADGRKKALAAIRYFWTETAANWWPAGDRLGGANSRSYDYLFARGHFDTYAWAAGWMRAKPAFENAGWIGPDHDNLVAFHRAAHVPVPGEWIAPIRSQIPRTIVQRWGAEPENTATNWVGRHASLGTSAGGRSREDRALVINLGDSPDIPQIILFMDGRGDPYGVKKVRSASGLAKALHLPAFVSSVQHGPEALQLLSYDPSAPDEKTGRPSCLLTHLTIPREAELWAGDKPLKPDDATSKKPAAISTHAPICMRIGDAAVALRILYANAPGGRAPAIHYIDDGKDAKARRLTIAHETSTPQAHAIAAVWVRVAENLDDAKFADFRKQFAAAKANAARDDAIMDITAEGLSEPLRIKADLRAQKNLLVEGGEPRPALLSVNGKEVGREILGGLF